MPMTPQTAANRIIRELHTSEAEIDRALSSSASLLATMTQARVDTELPLATGQVAIMRLVRSLTSLSNARADLVRTHSELLEIGQVTADLAGGPSDCPTLKARFADPVPLRIAS